MTHIPASLPSTHLKDLFGSPPLGNQWFKVNFHIHGEGNDPAKILEHARAASIDLIAITDHQSFRYYEPIRAAAAKSGRPIKVLPGIELTTHEGVHLLAIFPEKQTSDERIAFLGWLEIDGSGATNVASRRTVDEILPKIHEAGGLVIVPHPFAEKTGLLDSARKLSTKLRWLESGYLSFIQISSTTRAKIKYVEYDKHGAWLNRYVLSSANDTQIEQSHYCLAPFARSDAHTVDEISEGCSWFRMASLGIDGLKQVACEPRTRILDNLPAISPATTICALEIDGGYMDGQRIRFNGALNCLIGQNHSGKSTVLDLIRFALGHDIKARENVKANLLRRLNVTLGNSSSVNLYVWKDNTPYLFNRTFEANFLHSTNNALLTCDSVPTVYQCDINAGILSPAANVDFQIEVYEQGRIHALRDDLDRQLEMIDEFANVAPLKRPRHRLVEILTQSAAILKPLLAEHDILEAELADLPTLEKELTSKQGLIPSVEHGKWAEGGKFVSSANAIGRVLRDSADRLAVRRVSAANPNKDDFAKLFGQQLPELDSKHVPLIDNLTQWRDAISAAIDKIESARSQIVDAIQTLEAEIIPHQAAWDSSKFAYDQSVSETLAAAGVASPKELIDRIEFLQNAVRTLKEVKTPRLQFIQKQIDKENRRRLRILERIEELDKSISGRRRLKASELSQMLEGKITVEIDQKPNTTGFFERLRELVAAAPDVGRIQSRDGQLRAISDNMRPAELARALFEGGHIVSEKGSTTIHERCGVTVNTQNVLCRIAADVEVLNAIMVFELPDVPRISVRRHGEKEYADLSTGLSPGEQSAAILSLALQTRNAPLIIDQPEDELGYSYVVHLIVPKILRAKFSRQMLIVTHNANIPVLGDADLVIRMENQPLPNFGRRCVPTAVGCFEDAAVTSALLELEGGEGAFRFRRYRYDIPRFG